MAKIPETVDFAAKDLLPLVKVWTDGNRSYIRRMLWIGMLSGAAIGSWYARSHHWPRTWYYTVFWALSVEAYTLALGLRFLQRRHKTAVSMWVAPWLTLSYWIFFACVSGIALFVLEHLTGETSVWSVLKSAYNPNSALYANTLNALCLGVLVAFPSKLLAQPLLGIIRSIGFLDQHQMWRALANMIAGKVVDTAVPEPSILNERRPIGGGRALVPLEAKDYVDRSAELERLGEHFAAVQIYKEAIAKHPLFAVLHNNLGACYANMKEYALAKVAFEQAVALTSQNRSKGIVVPDSYPADPERNLAVLRRLYRG